MSAHSEDDKSHQPGGTRQFQVKIYNRVTQDPVQIAGIIRMQLAGCGCFGSFGFQGVFRSYQTTKLQNKPNTQDR